MKVRPLHDRIIVSRLEEGEQKVGGIIIPDTAKEKPQQGKVIAVGKGKVEKDGKVTPLDVKAGDTILFGKYAGQEIKLDGMECLIINEHAASGGAKGRGDHDRKVVLDHPIILIHDRKITEAVISGMADNTQHASVARGGMS